MKKTTMLMIVALLLLFTSSAYAGEGKGCYGDWGEKGDHKAGKVEEHMASLKEKLNLSDEQYQTLIDQKKKWHEERKATKDKLREKKTALMEELHKPELDMDKINAIQAETKALYSESMDQKLAGMMAMREILTPEQFQSMGEHMRSKMKGHKKKWAKQCSVEEKAAE